MIYRTVFGGFKVLAVLGGNNSIDIVYSVCYTVLSELVEQFTVHKQIEILTKHPSEQDRQTLLSTVSLTS